MALSFQERDKKGLNMVKVSNCDKCREWDHQAVQLRMHRWGGAPYTSPFVATTPSLMMYTAGGRGHSSGGLFVGFIPADHSRYRCGRYQLM
jgi:hypothetical protein